jgi:hypothetical protein
VIVPCAFTEAMLGARLTKVVAAALGPASDGVNVAATSTMRIFSADEPNPAMVATVIVADPLCPPLVPVMLAVPTATAETTPCALTVATEGLSDDQVVFWSMTFPS